MLGTRPKTAAIIRWMIRRDMPEVLAIEGASFAAPFDEDSLLRLLRYRTCRGMVAEHRGRVVGFMIYEPTKAFIHIYDIATHPDFRRSGVGRQMLARLVGKLGTGRMTQIVLTARETNLEAQRFYRACGFTATRVVRGYYHDTGEDGYEFRYALAGHTG